jgi:hypothetical protein
LVIVAVQVIAVVQVEVVRVVFFVFRVGLPQPQGSVVVANTSRVKSHSIRVAWLGDGDGSSC